MRPSPRSPPRDDISSSPSSAWSGTGSRSPSSATQDHLFPLTPESCFSPAPTIVTPDEFTLQLDVQLDKTVGGSPRKPSIAQLLPQPSAPSSKADPFFQSKGDTSKVQAFLRNGGWENMYDRFESSAPGVLPVSQDSTDSAFSWEAARPALMDANEPSDLSRCSRLIHEVSLLVGLAADDDRLSPGDYGPLVPDKSKQIPDILPLNLTPTKSLSSRKHRNPSLPGPTNTNVQAHPSGVPVLPSINTSTDNANATLRSENPPPMRSGELVTPIRREKGADAARPSLSPRRRHGQVFHLEPRLSNAYRGNAVALDETFIHPRKPPPKPTPNTPANRLSSLDRLECSLRNLEAHAPSNHRKSQSEGQPLNHVAKQRDKRPSLPPPRRLNKQRSTHDIMCHNLPRPTVDHYLLRPPPASRPIPLRQYDVPRSCHVVPLANEHREEDHTPGSFMDMDIPLTEKASQKQQASFRQVTSKEKMKSLVSVARRVSRGVIAWGKNLAGSTKPPVTEQEICITQRARV